MATVQVPGATRTLHILQELAQHGPLPAAVLARNLKLPRSSMYHLLSAMQEQNFITYYPEDRTWGLGVAVFEIGSAYLRHEPLERLARPLLTNLVATRKFPLIAHLGILQGNELLYLLKETSSRPMTLVTEVGVRLPAQLTATGRAILGKLSDAQLRAVFPKTANFQSRTDSGPKNLVELSKTLAAEQKLGYAQESGEISKGYQSIAMAVLDRSERPVSAIGLTFHSEDAEHQNELLGALTKATKELTRRIH